VNEKEIDEYLVRSRELQAAHGQAIDEYLRIVKVNGRDPMTEASLEAYRKAVEAHDAMVKHLLKAQGKN